METTTEERLLPVLERARAVGFLGPGPLRVHIQHADQFVAALPEQARSIIDLGSGGGLPGLPVLLARPELEGSLLDASTKRCAFLVWAVGVLDLASRVDVIEGRAEVEAHRPELRGAYDVVLCRGFGPPAQTLECSLGYVRPGGRIIISEPPRRRRWPERPLADLGLTIGTRFGGVVTFDVDAVPADHLPRPIKEQRRAPLFALD